MRILKILIAIYKDDLHWIMARYLKFIKSFYILSRKLKHNNKNIFLVARFCVFIKSNNLNPPT